MLVKSLKTKEIQLVYADVEPLCDNSGISLKSRLRRRPYHFSAGGAGESHWSVRLGRNGDGCFFPLGTEDEELAAAKATCIQEYIQQQGWQPACRKFSRELVLTIEWSSNPLLWTYTTIHTLPGEGTGDTDASPGKSRKVVLVVEPEAGVRAAVCWGINQQWPFVSRSCGSVEEGVRALGRERPHLVLLSRGQAEAWENALAKSAPCANPARVLLFATHPDGDRMFDSTPGGVEGYLIKRVKPDRLLEPLLAATQFLPADDQAFLPNVKAYFQSFLQAAPRRAPAPAPAAKLSPREREVLALLSKGHIDKEIARKLGISIWTVHDYVKSIFGRLNVHTRTEAVVRYLAK